jgi:hypothetical protein
MEGYYLTTSLNTTTLINRDSRRSRAVLSADPMALKIYTDHFLPGYVAFHATASKRYKLDDLNLGQATSV